MNAAYSSVLVQNLKVTLLDQKRGAAPASMLDCTAHMLFCFDEPEGMYSAALRFMLSESAPVASTSDLAALISRSTSQVPSN
jgi:hypothetical protein